MASYGILYITDDVLFSSLTYSPGVHGIISPSKKHTCPRLPLAMFLPLSSAKEEYLTENGAHIAAEPRFASLGLYTI